VAMTAIERTTKKIVRNDFGDKRSGTQARHTGREAP
jgi:hypothetical protein